MANFTYKAFSPQGKEQKGAIDADDHREARKLLRARGLRIAELEIRSESPVKARQLEIAWFKTRIDYARLFSDLSVLMNAGLGFDQSLRAVSADASNRTNQQFAITMLGRLASGNSPSQALSDAEDLRPDIVALVASGERSGRMAHVFSVLSAELEKDAAQKKAFIEAMIYPAFLLVMMACALVVITFVLVPAIAPIFESAGREPPLIIAVLAFIRDTLSKPSSLISIFSIFLLLAILWLTKRNLVGTVLSTALLGLPLVGSLVQKRALARYLQSLAMLLENGVAMPNALALSAECCPVTYWKSLTLIRDKVISGKRLPEAFFDARIFPASVVSLAAVGDEVNNLAAVLAKSANLLQGEAQRTLDRILALMTPAITIVLGFLVGGLVISVMTALLSINELSVQ